MAPPPRSDNVKVAVRVRPLNKRESVQTQRPASTFWSITSSSITQYVHHKPNGLHSFSFDHVFTPHVTNKHVFETLASPLVHSALQGINAVIFAYGQTAAGKTHTMLGNPADPGLTPRCLSQVFELISAHSSRTFRLHASYIEIYNEVIRDLLLPSNQNLKIHQHLATNTVYVDAHNKMVSSLDDVLNIISAGEAVRTIGATNMNEKASRSHTLFTLTIESSEIPEPSSNTTHATSGVAVRTSTLVLVDLAGSERVNSTKAQGTTLTEGAYINKSLLTLGTVINKLTSQTSKSSAHVPYRDSKLTRLLQPALGGNARTVIICAVTPAVLHMDETLSTLKFASRAKHVTNHAETNEFLDDRAKLRRAQRQIKALKKEMNSLRASMQARSLPRAAPTHVSDSERGRLPIDKSDARLMDHVHRITYACSNCTPLTTNVSHPTLDKSEERHLLHTLTQNSPQRIQHFGMTQHSARSGALSNLSDAVKKLQHELGQKQVQLDNVEPLVAHERGTSLFEVGTSIATTGYDEYAYERSSTAFTNDDSLTENSFDSSINSDTSSSSQASSVEDVFRQLRDSFEEKKFELDMLFKRLETLKSEVLFGTADTNSCEIASHCDDRSEKERLVGDDGDQTQRDTTEQEDVQTMVSNVQGVKPGCISEITADGTEEEEWSKQRRRQDCSSIVVRSADTESLKDYDVCIEKPDEHTVSAVSKRQNRLAKVAVAVRRVILASCALWFQCTVSRFVSCGKNGSLVGLCVGNVTDCSAT